MSMEWFKILLQAWWGVTVVTLLVMVALLPLFVILGGLWRLVATWHG